MTEQEYKNWQREHVASQPVKASTTYESYKQFCRKIGVKVSSQERYELACVPIGSWLLRKDD